MTRLFDPPDPNPGKLLQVAIAAGVPLWMELLDEKTKAAWVHTRVWNRTGSPTPLELMALAMAEVSLELLKNPGEDLDEKTENVRDYAGDYLRRIIRFGPGFASNVRDLADDLASNHSLCITLNWGVGGGAWYVVGRSDFLRMHLVQAREDERLARFAARFEEVYPKTLEKLHGVREKSDTFSALLKDLSERCDSAFREIYEVRTT